MNYPEERLHTFPQTPLPTSSFLLHTDLYLALWPDSLCPRCLCTGAAMQGPRSCTSLHRHRVSPSGEPSAQPPPLLPASPAARRNTSMRGGQPSSGGCMAPAPIRCEERPLHGRAATAPQLPLAGSMGCPRAARPASRYTPLKQLILICLCLHRSYRCRRRRGQGCEDTAFGIHANAARNSSILSLNHLHAHHYLEHTRSCEIELNK